MLNYLPDVVELTIRDVVVVVLDVKVDVRAVPVADFEVAVGVVNGLLTPDAASLLIRHTN